MFNCDLHGWSHIEKPCTICHPLETYTSSGTSIRVATDSLDDRDHLIEQMRGQMRLPEDIKEIKQLRAALNVAVEALETVASNGEGRGMGWTPAQHARQAIEKIKELGK